MERMDIGKLQPEMYKASQINGCVYCVDMHTTDAKAAGETDVRLHGISVWQEAPYFSEAERAWNRIRVTTRMKPANA